MRQASPALGGNPSRQYAAEKRRPDLRVTARTKRLCDPTYLHSYFGNPEHSPDLHLWSLPIEPALPHWSPALSFDRHTLIFASKPASHHLPAPQSPSSLHTQLPFVPSMALHLPALHASSQ